MTFDRLLYIDRLKGAGIDETVARAHAEALREALEGDRSLDRIKRNNTVAIAVGTVFLSILMIGLKLFH